MVAALCFDRSGLPDAVEAPRLHTELTEYGGIQLDVEPGLERKAALADTRIVDQYVDAVDLLDKSRGCGDRAALRLPSSRR